MKGVNLGGGGGGRLLFLFFGEEEEEEEGIEEEEEAEAEASCLLCFCPEVMLLGVKIKDNEVLEILIGPMSPHSKKLAESS